MIKIRLITVFIFFSMSFSALSCGSIKSVFKFNRESTKPIIFNSNQWTEETEGRVKAFIESDVNGKVLSVKVLKAEPSVLDHKPIIKALFKIEAPAKLRGKGGEIDYAFSFIQLET